MPRPGARLRIPAWRLRLMIKVPVQEMRAVVPSAGASMAINATTAAVPGRITTSTRETATAGTAAAPTNTGITKARATIRARTAAPRWLLSR